MASSVALLVVVCLIATTFSVTVCPNLRSAANFTVVAGSSVSNTGSTIINGNLAISSGTSLTGFNPMGSITGVTQLGNAVALQAQLDVTLAYNDFKGLPLTTQMTGVDLSGKTLSPGVYKFDAAGGINSLAGVLTLNGSGIYVFQVGSALTTTANSQIRVTNGANASCIFWQVGSSATLGQYSRFLGNILAYASVGFDIGISYTGSVYAQTAAVTLNADTITGQVSCDVCQIVPATALAQSNCNPHQNILFLVWTMVLISFF